MAWAAASQTSRRPDLSCLGLSKVAASPLSPFNSRPGHQSAKDVADDNESDAAIIFLLCTEKSNEKGT